MNAINAAPDNIMSQGRWTKEQLKLAFYLYCQLPFGRLHQGNPEIVELAKLIGRTPSAVAMKLVNFASLDPAITATGRKGLSGASALDREVWAEFHADWEQLATESEQLRQSLIRTVGRDMPNESVFDTEDAVNDFTGETKQVITDQRVKQHFFRRAVLSSYKGRCCMSGLSESRLLVASHIVPWSQDKANRLNPSNGLCLSSIHDRAFDQHLISLTDDYKILVGDSIKQRRAEPLVQNVFLSIEGKYIDIPERFMPDKAFVSQHRSVFENIIQ